MNLLETALRRIIADLEHAHAQWAIVGGLAVDARAEPRTTRDVDVVVAVSTDAEAENLVRSLHASGYRVRAIVEHESAGQLATARLSLLEEHDAVGSPSSLRRRESNARSSTTPTGWRSCQA